MEPTTKQKLLAACDGDVHLAMQMAGLLRKSIPRRLAAVKQALDQKDLDSLYKEVHGLKSATCYLHQVSLQEICIKIENCCRSANEAQLGQELQVLEKECSMALQSLEEE